MIILDFLQEDINKLSRYSRNPIEEFNQEIKTSLIELVRSGNMVI
ncbi:hypothetical protein [Bacillus sp. FJAT-27445]